MTGRQHHRPRWAGAALLVLIASSPAVAAESEPIVVFAAASMTNAVEEIIDLCGSRQPNTIRASFAASSVLAKQIDHGASAAVFVSANGAWMDYLERRGMLADGSRRVFAGNELVIIAPTSAPPPITADPTDVLAALPADQRIAIGDPDHVPAGMYARATLEHIGAWEAVRERAARAANVRAALALVEAGAAPLGIVYRTDARVSRQVRAVAVLPRSSHPPIVYETALVRGQDTPDAGRLHACMHSAHSAAILDRHGFLARNVNRHVDAR